MQTRHNMSQKEKIGQLFMFGFEGTEVTSGVLSMIEEEKVGSICLFPRNIESPGQVKKMNADLQRAAEQAGHKVPLIISIDQENGIVRRLKKGVTAFPGSMLLGATGDVEAVTDVSHATAKELDALGVNMNLAPVLDVNNNPYNPVIGVRSFGAHAEDVAEYGRAFIKGHRDKGVMTCVKHFPGHGDTSVDSHKALPLVKHPMERLKKVELYPFSKVLESGVDAVMTSHIHFSNLDDKSVPSSLSKNVTTHLLRDEMGYQGVVITDSLEMNAIQDSMGTVEGVIEAFKAGADILLVSHTRQLQKQAIKRMENAVHTGEITEKQLDRAVDRILNLKKKYLSDQHPHEQVSVPTFVGGEDHRALARQYYERGVTVLKGNDMLPVKVTPDDIVLAITVRTEVHSDIEEEQHQEMDLSAVIKDHHMNVKGWTIRPTPDQSDITAICDAADHSDMVIIGTDNAFTFQQQVQLIKRLEESGKPLIVIALRGPYDFSSFPEVPVFIAAYEPSTAAMRAAVDILFGKVEPKGKLPVTLPGME